MTAENEPAPCPRRVFLAGATGSIGRAVAAAAAQRGHEVVALVRPRDADGRARRPEEVARMLPGATVRFGDAVDPRSLEENGFGGERFDAVVSCIASRTGAPRDAWAVDHQANLNLLAAAERAGVGRFVLLSAICVQKPRLAFQHAKLAFEEALTASGLDYSIVRPTAFFKSLSGQIERLRRGKAYLMFGDGRGTACKPIADADLAAYLADCIDDGARKNRILPVGGPGPAVTPREMGERLFALLGREPRFQSVPPGLLGAIGGGLSGLSRVFPPLAEKAEFARIAHYYATESMLVWDPRKEAYDAAATPSFGSRSLFDHYRDVIEGRAAVDLGAHAVFERAGADV